jgi:hypothetical protein
VTAFEEAAAWHAAHGGGEMSFGEVVEAHAQGGYVFITPEFFLLGRRVARDWDEARRCDPWQVDPAGDCWHVWLAAGDWRGWERFLPYRLPWVSFHRRERLRVWALERFHRAKWTGAAVIGKGGGCYGIKTESTAPTSATATGPQDR